MALNSSSGTGDGEHGEAHSLSREEFRRKYSISSTTYYKMRRLKRAPAELQIFAKLIRITPEAERAWLRLMAEEAESEASKLEAARRRRQAKAAGKKAAKSLLHVSEINRQRKKRRRAAEASAERGTE
jgi:hypothetical protein